MLLSVLTFSCLIVLDFAKRPYQLAREELSQLARDSVDLVEVDRFAIFNGKESYDSLLGKTSSGDQIAVLKQAGDNKLYVYQLDQGISQEKAEQVARENGAGAIDEVTFGRLDNQPIWEVKSGTVYYVVDFETGTLTSKEGL